MKAKMKLLIDMWAPSEDEAWAWVRQLYEHGYDLVEGAAFQKEGQPKLRAKPVSGAIKWHFEGSMTFYPTPVAAVVAVELNPELAPAKANTPDLSLARMAHDALRNVKPGQSMAEYQAAMRKYEYDMRKYCAADLEAFPPSWFKP
jgi:hypothetical protein